VNRHRTVKAAFNLYPHWWRDRYLGEAKTVTVDLIESGRSRPGIVLSLCFGALRTRLGAGGMPMEYGLWVERARGSIVLATAPTLAAIPLVLTLKQVPALPSQTDLPSSHLATALYMVLVLAFVGLISTILWGYTSLSGGVMHQSDNSRPLRLLAKAPGYLAFGATLLVVASIVVEPHAFVSHGRSSTPLNGNPGAAHALWLAATTTFGLCWVASVTLLVAVTRTAALPVASLRSGKRVSAAVSMLLWLMSGAALALGAVYSRTTNELNGLLLTSVVGRSLFLFACVLVILSFVSTLGAILASRAWKVTCQLLP
jgi:hypothetical protein